MWVPPHIGACSDCKTVIENKIFPIADVRGATNDGRARADWVPCVPLHPGCRHSWSPYDEVVYEKAQREYRAMREAGFSDRRIDEMFDSSGQLRPEFDDVDLSPFE